MERVREFRTHALELRQLVPLLAARKGFVDGCPDDLADDIAGRRGRLSVEPSPFGFGFRVDHVRTQWGGVRSAARVGVASAEGKQ